MTEPKIKIMYYVYILKNNQYNRLYIGYSHDLKNRYRLHNAGKIKSTTYYKPWRLIYYEAYINKLDAIQREKQLKNHRAKEDLKIQLENSLKTA